MTNLGSIWKCRDITLPAKVRLVKAMVFPVVTYGCELDYKESWVLKNWCFWTVVLEKTLESPLGSKETQPINPTGNQTWMFTGRTDAGSETPILWPPDAKNWLIGKDPDGGKDWRWEKWMMECEMVGWHHQLSGHEFEQAPGVGDGLGSLVCCSPWGCKKSDITVAKLNWKEINLEYSLEGLMLKLKLQYFGHSWWRACFCFWERLRARGEWGSRGWDGWVASPTQWAWIWANWGR